ncbi:MAG: methionyl-tRNA formyltransferase [Deltaproteobacteria bacterium]|nr:methionyl-tRNA formyltransferase [Deltaproteobacteria bacterium]
MEEEKITLNLVFMGTPDFAAEILKQLLDWPGCRVSGAYTQPDRPCGRGRACRPSAVKSLALERGLAVFQPENFKAPSSVNELRALNADILVVAAYGLILPLTVLRAAPMGAVNVHASLLPRWRGAAPIQRALMAGEPVTGVSIMQMERGLDTGPVLLQRALAIGVEDTAGTLHDQLATLGGRLLVEALDGLQAKTLRPMPQDPARATYASKLTKDEGRIDWDRPAWDVHNHVRGVTPWPGAFFDWEASDGRNVRLSVFPGRLGRELEPGEARPGSILGLEDEALAVACRDRIYLVPRIKPACGAAMDARGFACGYLNRCD